MLLSDPKGESTSDKSGHPESSPRRHSGRKHWITRANQCHPWSRVCSGPNHFAPKDDRGLVSPDHSVIHEGAHLHQIEVLSMESTVHHGSHPNASHRQRREAKLRGQQAASGGPANPQAATRVNPEQASKVKLWAPTCPDNGEGRSTSGKQQLSAPAWSTGVVGVACKEGETRNVGGPSGCGLVACNTSRGGGGGRPGVGRTKRVVGQAREVASDSLNSDDSGSRGTRHRQADSGVDLRGGIRGLGVRVLTQAQQPGRVESWASGDLSELYGHRGR